MRPRTSRARCCRSMARCTSAGVLMDRENTLRVAIVIPAFNEEGTIRGIVQRALRQSRHVIVVAGVSTDAAVAALAALPIVLVRHASNLGKGAALWDGFARALQSGA